MVPTTERRAQASTRRLGRPPCSLLWESLLSLRDADVRETAAAVPLNTQQTPKLCGLLGIGHGESGAFRDIAAAVPLRLWRNVSCKHRQEES